ncbi:hypothetical protein J5X84_18970 [Streptosporangiaceae bacterium NEAU-GS5]|nr:hypothetical protein [Streptosporangiaceae bacterium NEAU-GS5]
MSAVLRPDGTLLVPYALLQPGLAADGAEVIPAEDHRHAVLALGAYEEPRDDPEFSQWLIRRWRRGR